ncbi:MAG: NAD(P)-dependent oxidoreductase [Candidatus Pacearchaeota archaeon]
MRILITGGNGFIAKNLFEQLKDDYNLTVTTRNELDLTDSQKVFEYIEKNKFRIIIHTANYDAAPKHSKKDPEKVLENNLKMFFNIVRCNIFFDKMIYFGSGAEYSRNFWVPKMREDYFDKNVPTDQYGFSKYVMTKYTLNSEKIYNLRLFAVFGKYEDWKTRIIPSICKDILFNKPIEIEQNKFYDFLHVNDLVKIVKWFIENEPKYKVYNVCTGKINDFRTIAEKLLRYSGKKLDIIIKNPVLGTEYSGDNTLLLNELKDFRFSNFDRDIEELYEYYNKNKDIIFKED